MAEEKKKFKVTIDNINIEVEPGTSILNASRMIGGDVVPPAMCYYSTLKGSGGKCRTCLVEVAAGSTADPRPMPKLVASCRTNVMDGMVVKNITSEKVLDARKGVVEFLLINHPLDCPICDQAGECSLQDLSYEHGAEATRYEFKRRTFVKHDIGPYIQLHMTRCILCFRCVFVADQLTTNSVVQDHYGEILFKLGRFNDAILAWTRALAGDGDSVDRADLDKKIRSARQKLPKR